MRSTSRPSLRSSTSSGRSWASRVAIPRSLPSTDWRCASVGCAVNTGLSSRRGSAGERSSGGASAGGPGAGLRGGGRGGGLGGVGLGGEPVDELVDRALAGLVAGPALGGAVGLLGDVRQVEVGREGPGEHGGGPGVE